MLSRRHMVLVAFLLLMLALAACGKDKPPEAEPPPPTESSALATAAPGAPSSAPTTSATGVASESDRDPYLSLGRAPVTPFTNVAPYALKNGTDRVWNWRPGAVVFDYDRDGDLDFYVTDGFRTPNFLYRNEGDVARHLYTAV